MPDHYADNIYSDINRKKQIEGNQKYKPFSQEIKAINKADKAGNLTDQDRIEGHKRASNIYRGIEEQSSGSPVGDDIITKARLTFNKLSPFIPRVQVIREIFKPWFDTDSRGNITFNPNKVTAENYLESTRNLIKYQIQNPGMGYLPASEDPALTQYSGQIDTIKKQRFTPEQIIALKDQMLRQVNPNQLEYYSSNIKPTLKKDLHLYGKKETDFNQVNNFNEGFDAAEASISAYPGKRWPGLDLKIGNEYVRFYQSKGQVQVLPYNKWHQLRRSPFKVPKGIKANLQKYEGGQLDLLNPNNEIVKYNQGTVNKFIDYINKELDYQRAVQKVTEKLAKKALEAAGLPYRRNKTNISVDKSHAVPRSKGGSGYTFLEYWRANQQAGARDILDDQVLLDLGIPRNWNEYFIRWHQEQGKGNPATDLGRLSEISWDDYDQASQGADINTIKIRRKTINHFIQRQLEDPTFADQPTLPEEVPPGMENWTNRDQFELLVRESKGFNMYQDVIGSGDIESTFNAKQFDLKWRAETFGEVDQLKSDIQLDKKFKKAKRQYTKQEKLDQSKIRIKTEAQEKKGQTSVTDKLLGPKETRKKKTDK